MSLLAVSALLLAAVAPLPEPRNLRAGQLASGCIYYYRLQTTGVPGGSAACEAQGYGLAFMRAHWKEIEAVEQKRKDELDAQMQRANEIAAARAHAEALRGPCEAMILDGGPGPDGGQALCDMAGFTRVYVGRKADRERREAEAAQHQEDLARGRRLAIVSVVVVALFVGLGVAVRRRR